MQISLFAIIICLVINYYWTEIYLWINLITTPASILGFIAVISTLIYGVLQQYRINHECPKCGSFDSDRTQTLRTKGQYYLLYYECQKCDYKWSIKQETAESERIARSK